MKLVIINGSPRGIKSNSNVIANWVVDGVVKNKQVNPIFSAKENIQKDDGNSTETKESIQIDRFIAAKISSHRDAVDSIEDNSTVLVIFPLYVDAMPAITKLFFEELETLANKRENVKIYYIVHSGFDGANHCRAVEKYLVYLTDYLGFEYMGTAIKPGSEGIRLMPVENMLDIVSDFAKLSKDIANGSSFGIDTLKSLAKFELPSEEYKNRIEQSNGSNGYFSYLLKQNNAFDRSFDKPYQKK